MRGSLLLFSLLICLVTAAKVPPVPKAQWIWQPGISHANCWMRFRKQVTLDRILALELILQLFFSRWKNFNLTYIWYWNRLLDDRFKVEFILNWFGFYNY